ncbi:hypothetical protein RUM43_004916 [Polyplax serrata]|uniref:Uncharacterized protein n=1 Tax=Polyplax serrata TaxID=468196 RepID=A0AAN8SE74_POLSC
MNENDERSDQSSIASNATMGMCHMSTKSRTSAVVDKPLPLDRVAVHSGPFNRNVSKGFACSGQIEPRKLIKKTAFIKTVSSGSRQEGGKSSDGQIDSIRKKQYVGQDYVVSDCWGTNDALPVKFIEPLKESCLEDDPYTKKQKLGTDANNKKSPPYTKEFHVLTEVQKTRILRVVEDVVKKLAHEDSACFNMSPGGSQLPLQSSSGKLVYRKFSLPWIVIKVIEMVLCHIIQGIFLSEGSYYQRKGDFLPVVFTYYLTLIIVLVSLIAQLSCSNSGSVQNPCYFMGIVSSCILTLITSLGLIIMLTAMKYYKTFGQILVLVFTGILLCVLFTELCLFYVEVKNVWNLVRGEEIQTAQEIERQNQMTTDDMINT